MSLFRDMANHGLSLLLLDTDAYICFKKGYKAEEKANA